MQEILIDSAKCTDAITNVVVGSAAFTDEATLWRQLETAEVAADIPGARHTRGHFTLISRTGNEVRVLTDRGGSTPVFWARHSYGYIVGTNVDEVASTVGANIDITSAYDFLLNSAICHPFTFYKGVSVCEPGSLTVFRNGTEPRISSYWAPSEANYLATHDAIEAVSDVFSQAVKDAQGAGPVSIFFSGGEDSRLIAATVSVPKTGSIFLPHKNREYVLASAAAKVLGFPLHLAHMQPDHYACDLDQKQKIIGSGFDCGHFHSYGLDRQMPQMRTLGGWGSDTFLKGYYLKKDDSGCPIFGIGSTWSSDVPEPARAELIERRNARLKTLSETLPTTAYEWDRFWPISAHEHYANFAGSRRIFDMREPFLTSEMVQVTSQIRAQDKTLHRIMRGLARRHLGLSGFLPRSEGQIPRLGDRANRLAFWLLIRPAFDYHKHHIHKNRPQGPWIIGATGIPTPIQAAASVQNLDAGKMSKLVLAKCVGPRLSSRQTRMLLRAQQITRSFAKHSFNSRLTATQSDIAS